MSIIKKHLTTNAIIATPLSKVYAQQINYGQSAIRSVSDVVVRHFEDYSKQFIQNTISSGFICSLAGGMNVSVSAGTATIFGRWVRSTIPTTITISTTNNTYYIILRISDDGGTEETRNPLNDGIQLISVASSSFVSTTDHILGIVIVSGGVITSLVDRGAAYTFRTDVIEPKNTNSVIIRDGTYPSSTNTLTVANSSIYHRINNAGIYVGQNDPFRIHHDGTNSFITFNSGTSLYIQNLTGANDLIFRLSGKQKIQDANDSNVNLLNFDTSARTFTIGQTADLITSTINGEVILPTIHPIKFGVASPYLRIFKAATHDAYISINLSWNGSSFSRDETLKTALGIYFKPNTITDNELDVIRFFRSNTGDSGALTDILKINAEGLLTIPQTGSSATGLRIGTSDTSDLRAYVLNSSDTYITTPKSLNIVFDSDANDDSSSWLSIKRGTNEISRYYIQSNNNIFRLSGTAYIPHTTGNVDKIWLRNDGSANNFVIYMSGTHVQFRPESVTFGSGGTFYWQLFDTNGGVTFERTAIIPTLVDSATYRRGIRLGSYGNIAGGINSSAADSYSHGAYPKRIGNDRVYYGTQTHSTFGIRSIEMVYQSGTASAGGIYFLTRTGTITEDTAESDPILRMKIQNDGNIALLTTPSDPGTTSQVNLGLGTSGVLRIQSDSDYVDIGAQNTSYVHIYSNNKAFAINNHIRPSSNELYDLGESTASWRTIYLKTYNTEFSIFLPLYFYNPNSHWTIIGDHTLQSTNTGGTKTAYVYFDCPYSMSAFHVRGYVSHGDVTLSVTLEESTDDGSWSNVIGGSTNLTSVSTFTVSISGALASSKSVFRTKLYRFRIQRSSVDNETATIYGITISY